MSLKVFIFMFIGGFCTMFTIRTFDISLGWFPIGIAILAIIANVWQSRIDHKNFAKKNEL